MIKKSFNYNGYGVVFYISDIIQFIYVLLLTRRCRFDVFEILLRPSMGFECQIRSLSRRISYFYYFHKHELISTEKY